jgi:hypothetical protein
VEEAPCRFQRVHSGPMFRTLKGTVREGGVSHLEGYRRERLADVRGRGHLANVRGHGRR